MTKVLVISPAAGCAPLEIAGPALRYRQLCDELRRGGVEVTHAIRGPGDDADWSRIRPLELARGHDAVVCPQGLADEAAELARRLPAAVALAIDCYAPALVERALLAPGDARFASFRRLALAALARADLLLVANEPQWAYVTGMLAALGRMLPERPPPAVVLAPMGAPAPRPTAVAPDPSLVLWYGGLWPWFDGTTALGAFALAVREQPLARLRILGGRHPMGAAADTLDSVLAGAAEAGLADRVDSVPWAALDVLPDQLAEAACALCLAYGGSEHRLAQRTRLLDLLSAGVPFVCTEGESLGDRAVAAGAAVGVPVGGTVAAGDALTELLGDAALRSAMGEAGRQLARELAPERTLAEGVRWLASPQAEMRTPFGRRRRRL